MPASLPKPAVTSNVRVHAKPAHAGSQSKGSAYVEVPAARILRFRCPACGSAIRARLSAAGKRGRCPACREALVFPDTGAASAPATRQPKVEPRSEKLRQPHVAAWRCAAIFLAGVVLGVAGGRWVGQSTADIQVGTRMQSISKPAPANAEVPREASRLHAAEGEEPQPQARLETEPLPEESPFLKSDAPELDCDPVPQAEPALAEPPAPEWTHALAEELPWREANKQPLPEPADRTPVNATPLDEEMPPEPDPIAPLDPDFPVASIHEEMGSEKAGTSASDLATEAGQPDPTQAAQGPELPQPKAMPSNAPPPNPELPARPEIESAREVQQLLNDRYRGKDSKMRVSVVLTNQQGDERIRNMIRYRSKDNGLTKTLLCFMAPSDVRNTSTLTLEMNGKDDMQRIYLPALKKNRIIPSPEKGKSWMGTDFSFEDLREKKVDDFTYSQLTTESCEGIECWHYVMTPKAPGLSSYARMETWVRKDICELARRRYYDSKDRCFKELIPRHYKKFEDSSLERPVWLSTCMEMTHLVDRHKSAFIIEWVAFNIGVAAEVFSPRGMEKVQLDFGSHERVLQGETGPTRRQ